MKNHVGKVRRPKKSFLQDVHSRAAEVMNVGRGIAVGLVLSSVPVHAEEVEALSPHELQKIGYESINVAILIVGLIYFLRKPIKAALADKKRSFEAAAEKAKAALQAAESERSDIQIRLTKLQSTAAESLSRARAEAADMRKQMLADAAEFSARLQREAQASAVHEAEKAKENLRVHLIAQATALAEELLEKKVTAEDQSRLQGEFISNIQSVQS